jgi:hypothetical protein
VFLPHEGAYISANRDELITVPFYCAVKSPAFYLRGPGQRTS